MEQRLLDEVIYTDYGQFDLVWGETGGVLDGIGPGTYRLRVNARDRDAGREGEFVDGPIDAYLLQLWPASSAPDAILRVGSSDAEYWHREWGSRR